MKGPLACEAKFRASLADDASAGSLRIDVKALLQREQSEAQWILRDPFRNLVAKISQNSKGTIIESKQRDQIQKALDAFPKRKWWEWLSVALGYPQVISADHVIADSWNRPIGYHSGPFSLTCSFSGPHDNADKSCIAESKESTKSPHERLKIERIKIEFTFVVCRPPLH